MTFVISDALVAADGWLNENTFGLNPDLAKIKLHDDTGAGPQLLHKSE